MLLHGCVEQVNFIGTVYAVLCTALTAQYQIYVASKQKELELNSMQLLMNMMPVSAGLVLVLIPFMDSTGFFFEQDSALTTFPYSAVSVTPIHIGLRRSCDSPQV